MAQFIQSRKIAPTGVNEASRLLMNAYDSAGQGIDQGVLQIQNMLKQRITDKENVSKIQAANTMESLTSNLFDQKNLNEFNASIANRKALAESGGPNFDINAFRQMEEDARIDLTGKAVNAASAFALQNVDPSSQVDEGEFRSQLEPTMTPNEISQHLSTFKKERRGEQTALFEDMKRKEYVSPTKIKQFEASSKVKQARFNQKNTELNKKITTTDAKLKQFARVDPTAFEKAYTGIVGIVGEIQQAAGTDSNDINLVLNDIENTLDDKGNRVYSSEQAAEILYLAYQRDPFKQESTARIRTFNQSRLEDSVEEVKRGYEQYSITKNERLGLVAQLNEQKQNQDTEFALDEESFWNGGRPTGTPGEILRQTLLARQEQGTEETVDSNDEYFTDPPPTAEEVVTSNTNTTTTPKEIAQSIVRPTTGQKPVTEGRIQFPAITESKANQVVGEALTNVLGASYDLQTTIPRAAGRGLQGVWDRLMSDRQGQIDAGNLRQASSGEEVQEAEIINTFSQVAAEDGPQGVLELINQQSEGSPVREILMQLFAQAFPQGLE